MNIPAIVARLAVAAIGLVSLQDALADEAEMLRAKKCMSCHTLDQKLIGPAFKSVAAKYANDTGAEARLAKKIREGGSGAWGVVPMPANPEVSAAEAQRLAHWVLLQK